MIWRMVLLMGVAVALSGCVTTGVGSVKGGECRVFERPEYAVRGKARYDQNWIDSQIEGGVGGCGWKRPKPRPPEFDRGAAAPSIARAEPRPGVIKRIKNRIAPRKAAAAQTAPAPVPYINVVPAAPPPRDPVDELLSLR